MSFVSVHLLEKSLLIFAIAGTQKINTFKPCHLDHFQMRLLPGSTHLSSFTVFNRLFATIIAAKTTPKMLLSADPSSSPLVPCICRQGTQNYDIPHKQQ